MTIPKNFPGNQKERRISALERRQKDLAKLEARFPNDLNNSQILFLRREIATIENRIITGGKKYTKKVGKNLGRR